MVYLNGISTTLRLQQSSPKEEEALNLILLIVSRKVR